MASVQHAPFSSQQPPVIAVVQGPKQGIFVGAASQSGPVSPRLQVPCPKNTLHTIPKLELAEAAQQLCHYSAQVCFWKAECC